MCTEAPKKTAKRLIKKAKKHPEQYSASEVLYAKLIRRAEKKNENSLSIQKGCKNFISR